MAAAVLWIDSSPAATKTIGLRQIGGVTNKAVDVRMSRSMERRKENQKQQLSITMFTVLRSTWYIVLQPGTYNPHTKGRTIMKPTKANHRTQSDSTNGKRQTRRSATKNKYYLGAVLERQLPGTFSPSAKALGIHHPPSAPTAAPAPTRSLHLAETRQQTKHRFRRRRKYFKDPRMAEAAAPIAKPPLLFQTSKPRRGVRLSPRGTPTLCSLLALVALQSRQSHKHVPPYDLAVPYFPPRTRTNYAAD